MTYKKRSLGFEKLEDRIVLAVQPLPVPLSSLAPGGSLIYRSGAEANIETPAEVESFTVNLDGGQSIAVVVDPSALLNAAIAVKDPNGNVIRTASASGPGLDELAAVVAATDPGTYTIDVSAVGGTTGSFAINVVLNADIESEAHGGAANDSAATAQDLNGSFTDLGFAGASRGAVVGALPLGVGGDILDQDDFETGSLDGQWQTSSSTPTGRIQVTNAFGAAAGSFALLMDVPSGNNLNEAIWTVDLSGLTEATLNFSHADFSDEETSLPLDFVGSANGDGVAISDDGVSWRTVLNATSLPSGTWGSVSIDLDAAAAAAGMTLGPNFRIKFQQFDNNALVTDGRGYDQIQVLSPAPLEDWYRFDLPDGQPATIAMAGGGPAAAIELYAGDGTTLLAKSVGAANLSQVISNFVAPANPGPDNYHLRVRGQDLEYRLVVTRGADFDVEPNDDLAPAAQDITLPGVVLGRLSGGNPGAGASLGLIEDRLPWGSNSNTTIATGLGYTVTQIPSSSLLSTDLSQFDVIVMAGDQSTSTYDTVIANFSAVETYVRAGGVFVVNYAASGVPLPYQYDLLPGAAGVVVTGVTGTDVNVLDANSGLIVGPGGIITDTNLDNGSSSTHGYTTSSLPADANAILSTGVASQVVTFDYPFDSGHVVVHTMPVEFYNGGPHGIGQVFHRNLFNFAAGLTTDVGDYYRVAVNAGDQLDIQTILPAAGPGEFVNNLDIAIELYDPTGNLVASTQSGTLAHAATLTGNYTVRLLAENNTLGEYVLKVTGHTGTLPPFAVTASNPAAGAALPIPPTQLVIDVSDHVLLGSVDAADLTVDGTPATNVSIIDADTLAFALPPIADGSHTLSIAAGAISNLQGQQLAPFSIQISIDATGPRVMASSILEGNLVNAGTLVYTATFNEGLDSSVLDAGDVQLQGLATGLRAPTAFNYNPTTSTLTLEFSGLPEDDFTLTLFSGATGLRDVAGNLLDGEANPSTTVPSGNGIPGGNFVVNFTAETTTGAFPTPFVPAGPLGSLIYTSSVSGRIVPSTDRDEYSVSLDAGQRLSLVVAAEFQAAVTLFGPNGEQLATTSAAAAGDDVLLQAVLVDVAGNYTVRIESLGGTTGNYTIDAILNALPEPEEHDGPSNDSPVDAQDIDAPFFVLPDGSSQYAAVSGVVTGGTAGVLFDETFPTTTFDPARWLLVNNAGIDDVGLVEPSEPFSARLNGSPNGGDAIESVVINLSAQSGATLSYYFEQTGGGETVDSGEDLILWYQNADALWVELERQLGSGPNMSVYEFRQVNLPAEALHANFRFRFTNIGTSGNFDDWFVDNVTVTGDSVIPDVGDWYRFSLNDGQSASIALAASGPVTLDLYDATGTVKLASGISAANWSQTIANFVDTTSDGTATAYLLNVRGSNVEYQLSVAKGADLDFEQNDALNTAQDISGINHALGHVSVGDDDWYQIAVNSGNSLAITITAPAAGPFEFVNPLGETGGAPLVNVELYDPAGNLVQSGAAGLSHLADQTGIYRVRVQAIGTSGEYVLAIDGATGLNQPPRVVASVPIDGAFLNQFPASYVVTFSEPLLENSITADDLLFNGQPAASNVVRLDALTYQFDIDPDSNTGDGTYSVEIAAGALLDLSGRPNEAFAATFTIDATGPIVLNVLFNGAPLPLGGNLSAASLTVDVFFNEDLREEIVSGQLGPEDVVLTNKLTGQSVSPTTLTYDAALNKATLVFATVDDAIYTLTLLSANGAFEDRAGNDLDGEPIGPSPIGTPSGNGAPGGNYVVQFQTDAIGARAVAPFERLRPLGSFMAESADNVGVIGSPGDFDDFVVYVQQGQILSAVLTPGLSTATLSLSLVGVAGPVASAAPGQPVALAPELIPVSGPITLRVFGNATSSYRLDVYANAAHERVVGDSADGNELSLNDTWLELGSGRWGAIGEIAANPALSTVYAQDFNLNAGNFSFNNSTFGSGNGLWHRSTGRQLDVDPNHSPAGSLYFGRNEGPFGGGNYDTETATSGTATSPTITLPNAEVVLLSLNHFLATDGVFGRDIASIAVNAGSGFITVASTADGSLGPNTGGEWANLSLDLSQFAGLNVTLQFQFDSINALQNQFEGWYIDDVQLLAANSYLADIDEYTLDLSNYLNKPIDILVAGQTSGQLAGATIQLLGPGGATVLATASNSPLGTPAANFDQAILAYTPPLPGVYTLRVVHDKPGQYGLLVTEALPVEIEPNDTAGGALRPLGTNSVLGHVGGASEGGAQRLFAVVSTTSEVVEYDPETGAELNRFALPEPATGQPDALGFNGTSLFYAEGPLFAGSGILYELDPDTGAVLDSDTFASLGLTPGITGLGAYGGLVFAIDTSSSQVLYVDTVADVVVGSVVVPATTRGGAAGAGERGSLFVNSFLTDLIFEVDPNSGQVINSFSAPDANINGLAYVDGSLFAGDAFTRQIFELNPDTGAVLNFWTATGNVSAMAGDDASGLPPNLSTGTSTGSSSQSEPTESSVEYVEIPPAALTAFRPEGVSLEELAAQLSALNYQSTGGAANDSPLGHLASVNALISVSESEPNDSIATAEFVPLGFDVGEDAAIDVSGTGGAGGLGVDFFRVTLSAGDILGANVSGGTALLQLYNASNQLVIGSSQDLTAAVHPPSSPLPGGGNAALSAVIPATGDYFVAVNKTSGTYSLNLRLFRPVLENELAGTHQKLFLDFNGASIDISIFGGSGVRTLSPLTSFLAGWGLTAADENAVIDAIIASVEESISADIRSRGNNGDFDLTGIPGQFDIEILNSRDHADPFGSDHVSRVIVGGSIAQFGISTIGIAETIDVGNFDTTESAVVLLDLLSAAGSNPNSLNQYARAPGVSIIDLIGVGVGNIVAHEAGHFFANWHTNRLNASRNIMDQGGDLANTVGLVGGVWGDGNEIDVDFGPDQFTANEGFTGTEDTLNSIAFGLTTGTFNSGLIGPRVVTVAPPAGVGHDLSVTKIELTFSETITASSANNVSNYQLLEAGPNGILENGAGDDLTIPFTPVFDGDKHVDLIIRDGSTPLGFGTYRLIVEGDNSIEDLDGNPLNSITGPGGGSDFTHDFKLEFAVPPGGDFYRLNLVFGQRVTLETRTPWNDPLGSLTNGLDPQLLIYNNVGTPIVIDGDSGDGNNAHANFIATVDGPYFVQVVAQSGAGEYILDSRVENVVLLGDYNRDGAVSAADYAIWRNTSGTTTTPYQAADGNGDGTINRDDYLVWSANYGATFATATDDQLVVIGPPQGLALAAALPEAEFETFPSEPVVPAIAPSAVDEAVTEEPASAATLFGQPSFEPTASVTSQSTESDPEQSTLRPLVLPTRLAQPTIERPFANRAARLQPILNDVAQSNLLWDSLARSGANRSTSDDWFVLAQESSDADEGDESAIDAADSYFSKMGESLELLLANG